MGHFAAVQTLSVVKGTARNNLVTDLESGISNVFLIIILFLLYRIQTRRVPLTSSQREMHISKRKSMS